MNLLREGEAPAEPIVTSEARLGRSLALRNTSSAMNSKIIWIIFVVLFFLHQDVWFWDDRTLVFGFMPVGLAYHAGFSIAAALLWAAALKFAWPSEVEAWADEADEQPAPPASEGGAA